uniref:Uncharacterized protein n=1 Tax=uncultured bacterium BLR12 TaxID=506514 RepID=C0IND2_9BACT|nr:hypothetical protein AKSOIL_0203 [uncultured bacterium BLR12]
MPKNTPHRVCVNEGIRGYQYDNQSSAFKDIIKQVDLAKFIVFICVGVCKIYTFRTSIKRCVYP